MPKYNFKIRLAQINSLFKGQQVEVSNPAYSEHARVILTPDTQDIERIKKAIEKDPRVWIDRMHRVLEEESNKQYTEIYRFNGYWTKSKTTYKTLIRQWAEQELKRWEAAITKNS